MLNNARLNVERGPGLKLKVSALQFLEGLVGVVKQEDLQPFKARVVTRASGGAGRRIQSCPTRGSGSKVQVVQMQCMNGGRPHESRSVRRFFVQKPWGWNKTEFVTCQIGA
ncbi:hypothetical protein PIIN_06608 [Serendipita indica DSM 11827]|uniref:Uncharacterized protein n=1 Tax=Serendipita indica (strain DSM 11827) TaxID=1109443 RepID=G4TMX6_SERID|nr:hypothetical protein PIIN_06608 [Serendipita indica DSM 11827]